MKSRYAPNKYCIEVSVSPWADQKEIEYKIRAAKRKAVEELLDNAYHDRYWIVRFEEEWPSQEELSFYDRYNSSIAAPYHSPCYRIYFTIKEAPFEDVRIAQYDEYDLVAAYENTRNKPGILNKIKKVFGK